MHVEPMRLEDLDEVLSIEKSSFPTPWSRNMFLEEMENRNSRLIVFKIERAVVGYVCFWAVLDEAHLLNIAVHPVKRHQGLGRTMMAEIEALCAKEGLRRVILEVARKNVAARSLYRQCGFHSIGFRKNYYSVTKDDALIMEKYLPSSEMDPGEAKRNELG
jgi:[ribosomal protein S18]-alanine N-acetyltransferase